MYCTYVKFKSNYMNNMKNETLNIVSIEYRLFLLLSY